MRGRCSVMHELTAGKILAGLRQQHRHLKRKHMLTVEILMQAVVVARRVPQQQWRRRRLRRVVTTRQEMPRAHAGKRAAGPQPLVPGVGDRRQMRIERFAQSTATPAGSGYAKYRYSPRPKPCRAITTRLRNSASSAYNAASARHSAAPRSGHHGAALRIELGAQTVASRAPRPVAPGTGRCAHRRGPRSITPPRVPARRVCGRLPQR